MSDMSKLKIYSVPEKEFENFQAASILKQMELNTHNVSIPKPAYASNEEISSTIVDEVQSVNSTLISQDTSRSVEPSKRGLRRKVHNTSGNVPIDNITKDQQVSTTQISSAIINKDLEKEVPVETVLKHRRSRRQPLKRKVGRPKKQTSLVEKLENKTLPSDKEDSTAESSITEDYVMTENEVVDSTTFQIPSKTKEVKDDSRKIELVIISNSDNLSKEDKNKDTVQLNIDNITPDGIETKYNTESDDDPDEISLSKLKKTLSDLDNLLTKTEGADLQNVNDVKVSKTNKNTKKRSSKVPVTSDLVCNIESIDGDNTAKVQTDEPSLPDNTTIAESSSGRPQRKRGKVNLLYEQDSDEDPFANVELSEDDGEPIRSKKGKKCYSDDEYVPDEKCEKKLSTDSDIEKDDVEMRKPRKKRSNKGLKKKQKNSDSVIHDTSQTIDLSSSHIEVSQQDEDMEMSITNSNANKSNNSSNSWGNTNEFENFLAMRIQGTSLKIKRVTNKENSAITHLEIPVIDSYSKTADVYSQTDTTKNCTTAVQTTTHNEIQMDNNIRLSAKQAEKACEFITDMVKATSKLGELMTQKSDDFIQKKIKTSNLTDTIKMDHYVKKSLLLFKLAKDSIMDIEESLASKYEDFLREHKLSQYTSVPKILSPTVALIDDDSDCEIVEETLDHNKQKVKGKHQFKFNPKTVFLNKELSIKIAKKPNDEQKINNKINIKGKNSVWISDSVLVKKVKPTQSFLDQDSRNKKPPDTYVTNEMVSDFFKKYYYATPLHTCGYLLTTEWQNWRNLKIWHNRVGCYYFSVEPNNTNLTYFQSSINAVNVNDNINTNANCDTVTINMNPKSLFTLAIQALQKIMIQIKNHQNQKEISQKIDPITDLKAINNAEKLINLCLSKIKHIFHNTNPHIDTEPKTNRSLPDEKVSSLKMLCYHQIVKDFFTYNISRSKNTLLREKESGNISCKTNNTCLLVNSDRKLQFDKNIKADNNCASILESRNILSVKTVSPLKFLCYHMIIQKGFTFANDDKKLEKPPCYKVNTLLSISLNVIWQYQKNKIKHESYNNKSKNENNVTVSKQVETLISLCLNIIHSNINTVVGCIRGINGYEGENNTVLTKQGKNIDNIDNCESLNMKQSNEINEKCKNDKVKHFATKSLKHIALSFLLHIMSNSNTLDIGDLNSEAENTSNTLTNHANCLEEIGNKHEERYNLTELVQCQSNGMCVKPLSQLCFEEVKLIYNSKNVLIQNSGFNSIQINSVNTVPEEVFLNLQEVTSNMDDCNVNSDDEQTYDDHLFDNCSEDETHIECNFESKQRMLEICPPTQTNDYNCFEQEADALSAEISDTLSTAQIKIEPVENYMQDYVVEIKTEPDLESNLMPRIQCIQAAKLENCFDSPNITTEVLSCFGNDFHSFESLLIRKGRDQVVGDKNNYEEKIFSQSSLRIRRQFEPDSDNENDNTMSLLVPNTYEPLNNVINRSIVSNASHNLEEGGKIEKRKKKNEKRIEKRKNKSKASVSTDVDGVEKTPSNNKNDVNKEKLHDKITPEEEEAECSDDSLNIVLSSRRKSKSRGSSQQEVQNKSRQKPTTGEIQCNDVDSTQETNANNEPYEEIDNTQRDYTGLLEYNKYVNDLYSKLKRQESTNATKCSTDEINEEIGHEETQEYNRSFTPAFNSDEPVELLQCEPSLPVTDLVGNRKSKRTKKNNKSLESNAGHDVSDLKGSDSNRDALNKQYDVYDSKLYQQAIVALEKLPEKVVEIYFKSQGIKHKDNDDNKCGRVEIIPTTDKNKSKKLKTTDGSNMIDTMIGNYSNDSDSMTPFGKDTNNDNESLPDVTISENPTKSKPEDSDEMELEKLVKKEEEETRAKEESSDDELLYTKSLRFRKLSKETKEAKTESNDSKTNSDNDALLTADKVMKKDILLLNTPAVEDKELDTKESKCSTKSERKAEGIAHKDVINADDYSSSEEEKQWVTTKEKLLKRLLKKQDDVSMDATKRAKLVSEFIAKCKTVESRKRYSRSGRSKKKNFLERQKQLNVLSRELFGEITNETHQLGKKSSQSFGKGRRNIRRVIDKKSLARSTLLANIEEIERKRRLLCRQNKLREILGCEEGVNVVVINDEVCLEYDFGENRPIVTVHPFFTQVMKAHQYEGVKFMWDACFESLELVGAGHAGGGCILAHCMGLGKTLQVLALLHTVLTHPGVGMRRVLVVCPLSTVLNWVDEINKWMKPVNDNIKVFELSKLKKTYQRAYQLEDWYTGGGIFIMGYEMFRNLSTLDAILDDVRPTIVKKIRTALLNPGPDIIICDEGHLLKNDSSVLAVAISRIATKRRIVLTGTPMQNNLREYYCMVNFVKPNLLGLYSEYANRFENPIINGQHRDSREEDIKLMKARTHILHKVLEGCLQRQEAAVLYPYLPKKHEYTAFIPLTKCQTDLYKHYLKHYAREAKHNVLRDYHILQKIWTHPQVLHNFQMKSRDANKVKVEKLEDDLACEDLTASEDVKFSQTEVWWLEYLEGGNMLDSLESSNKLYAVFRILDECIALGDKVLIFSTSLFTMDALEYFLKRIKKWSLGHEYYRLDGSVPAEVRQNWCREFNSPNNTTTNLFLISTRAGCLGLNMTAANRVIILDTSWNPAHDIQSIFRVYRFGQKKDCYIYRLVAMGTMEQKIYERSVTKQAVACRVVDSQQIDRHYNMEELTELYKFDETGASVESGVAAGVTDVALLRVARDAPLHAVYEHDSLLRDSHDQQLPEHERAAAWRQFEMEQGHSQMANLDNNLLRTPTKKIHGHDYAMSPSLALDNANTVNNKQKEKRSRKSKQKPSQNTGKEESVLEETHLKNEENKSINELNLTTEVQQIKNILVEQNVQSDFIDRNKIDTLVNQVQKVVQARLKGESLDAAPLVESLAKVFLQMKGNNDEATSDQTPTTSAVDKEDRISGEDNCKVYKNKKRKHHHTQQMDPDKTTTIDDIDNSDNVVETKKRRAAVQAKEYINSLNLKDTNVRKDYEDESWSQEENTGPLDRRQSIGNQNESVDDFDQTVDLRSSDESNEDDSNEDHTESNTVMVEIPDDDDPSLKSIVLSDDEAVVEIDKTEHAKNTKELDKVQSDENEQIPLHASLLESQYFINMVAYKYLEGNPVLDKDTALHAARYSARKALKEMQETGKGLCSGPLYDIGVKLIGIDTLKRLQSVSKKCIPGTKLTKQNKDSSIKEPVVSQSESIQAEDDVSESKQTRVYKKKSKQRSEPTKANICSKTQERKSSTDSDDLVLVDEVICEKPKSKKSNKTATTPSAHAPSTSKKIDVSSKLHTEQDLVVPIQLIKSSSNSTIRMTRPSTPLTDECILPDDDDDVCYITDTPATASTSKDTSCSQQISHVRSNTYPRNTTTPLAPTKSTVQPITVPEVHTLPVENPTLVSSIDLDNELTEAIRNINNEQNKKENPDTICLDSDDEDYTSTIVPKETQAATLTRTTSSHPDQPPLKPLFISVTSTQTIPGPSKPSRAATSQAQMSKNIIVNTTMGIINPSPQSATLVYPRLQCTNDTAGVSNSKPNGCKPVDVIKMNRIGKIYFLNPNQASVTRLITNPTPTTIPSPPTYAPNAKVGKIAIKALKVNTPPTKAKRVQSVSTAEQIEPVSYPTTTPKLNFPLQATKPNTESTVITKNGAFEIHYPKKKIKATDSKLNNEVVTECLDLTDIDQNDVPTAANKNTIPKVLPHTSNKKTRVSVVGSPKDFMFVRTGDRTKLEATTSRKRKEPMTPALGKFELKKKLTTAEAGPSTKPTIPPFKKLTLHDFNIDKIDDDIIELE